MGFLYNANQQAEQRVKQAIDLSIKAAIKYFGKNVLSIILMGSFPRGEGICKEIQGRVEILSDLDLLVVLKGHKKTPARLIKEIKQIAEKVDIDIDLRVKPSIKLRFYPKDTHTYDYLHIAEVIYGKDVLSLLPRVSQNNLGKADIESLFFNRAIDSIKKCSPEYLTPSSDKALLGLSYMAAKTMFTCTDIISIYFHSYSPFISERIKLTQEKIGIFDIPQQQFLKDLKAAFKFVFEQPDTIDIEEIYDYWLRVRQYLVSLFLFVNGRKNDIGEIFAYPFLADTAPLPYLERMRLSYKMLKISYFLYKKYNRFKLFWRFNPIIYCRMTSLMLYMAIDKDKEAFYAQKALEYFSHIYRPKVKGKEGEGRNLWMALRSNLLELHKLGVL